MTRPYRKFNDYLIEKLKDPKEAQSFLVASIIEYEEDHDVAVLMLALRYITEAQGGIAKLSARTHLNRQNLYKVLTGKTKPQLDTTLSIIKGLGFRLAVEPMSRASPSSNTPR